MRMHINRRQVLKLSLLSGLAISLQKLNFVDSSINNKNVVSLYKISVPNSSVLFAEIKKTSALTELNVFTALALSSFDEGWTLSYDLAKNSAVENSILLKSEKIFSDKNRSLYIRSTWSSFDDYLKFLDVAKMKSFHEELKKSGFQPELKVLDWSGKEFVLLEYT